MPQDRGGADGKDPGLGARTAGHLGAIPGGKDQRVIALQTGVNGDETVAQRQSGVRQPALRPRAGHRQGKVAGQNLAAGQRDLMRRHGDRTCVRHDGHAKPCRSGQQAVAGRPGQIGQGGWRGLKHGHQRLPARRAQTVRRGHGQFDPTDAAAHHHQTRAFGRAGDKRLPARGIGAKRLGRNAVFGKSRQIGQVRGDADVDAGKVIGNRRAVGQHDLPRRAVDAGGAVQDQPRPGKPRQPHQVDHHLAPRVMARHMAGQHARVGRDRTGVDQGQSCAGQGVHRPHPQHQRMGMTAADQHEIRDKGKSCVLHGLALAYRASLSKGAPTAGGRCAGAAAGPL